MFAFMVGCSQGSTELNLTKGRASGDPGYPVFSITDATTAEGNAGTSTLTFTITLSEAPAAPITVNYATSSSTATTVEPDYTATSGSLTFTTGTLS